MTRTRRARRVLLIAAVFVLSIGFGAMAGLFAGYLKSAPDLDQVTFNPDLTTYVYDIKGEIIGRFFRENRVYVPLEEIPRILQNAVVAVEDERFFEHFGIDVRGIARAAWRDLRQLRLAEGASTITQQLARNAFLSHDKTLSRKLQEILWAIQIERKYTKEEILETYLNEIYFNHGAYGVQAASQLFFGKDVKDLTLSEAALIAGVPQNPAALSPLVNLEAARARRNVVLSRMADLGYITQAEAALAREEEIVLAEPRQAENRAPHFTEYILQELLRRYGEQQVYGGGLHVFTTLDLRMQEAAQQALEGHAFLNQVTTLDEETGLRQPQAALVALDPHTGHIKAMIGGRDHDKFNRAMQAYRQPGSAIKPFIYVAAIEKGLTPADVWVDEPFEWIDPLTNEPWEPRNYDRTFRGPVTLREALEHSINIVAVRLLHEERGVDVRTVVDYARRMGISSLVEQGRLHDLNLAFALGGLTRGVSLLEMAQAYGVLANGGVRVEPVSILRVVGPNGQVLDEFQTRREVVLPEATSYLMTDLLRGVIERGTGRAANIGVPAAGKTGTTQDFTNAWFVGFTPDLVGAVWIGNDLQSVAMSYPQGNIGSRHAAEIWASFMRRALREADLPVRNFSKPQGLVEGILIDTRTGLLAREDCGIPPHELRREIFLAGTEPRELSPRCRLPFIPAPPGLGEDEEPEPEPRRPWWRIGG